jgi:hypothetical protein
MIEEPFYNQSIQGPDILSHFFKRSESCILTAVLDRTKGWQRTVRGLGSTVSSATAPNMKD